MDWLVINGEWRDETKFWYACAFRARVRACVRPCLLGCVEVAYMGWSKPANCPPPHMVPPRCSLSTWHYACTENVPRDWSATLRVWDKFEECLFLIIVWSESSPRDQDRSRIAIHISSPVCLRVPAYCGGSKGLNDELSMFLQCLVSCHVGSTPPKYLLWCHQLSLHGQGASLRRKSLAQNFENHRWH